MCMSSLTGACSAQSVDELGILVARCRVIVKKWLRRQLVRGEAWTGEWFACPQGGRVGYSQGRVYGGDCGRANYYVSSEVDA